MYFHLKRFTYSSNTRYNFSNIPFSNIIELNLDYLSIRLN